MTRPLPQTLLDAAEEIESQAEIVKNSHSVNEFWPDQTDKDEYDSLVALATDLRAHYLNVIRSGETAELVLFQCEDCDEEYRLPEDTEACPICHSLEISSV